VKPRRRKLGRLGDNLTDETAPDSLPEAEREVVAQEHTIAIPSEVAQERTTKNVTDDTVRTRRQRLGLD